MLVKAAMKTVGEALIDIVYTNNVLVQFGAPFWYTIIWYTAIVKNH